MIEDRPIIQENDVEKVGLPPLTRIDMLLLVTWDIIYPVSVSLALHSIKCIL